MCFQPRPVSDVATPSNIQLREVSTIDTLYTINVATMRIKLFTQQGMSYPEYSEEQEEDKFISVPVLEI